MTFVGVVLRTCALVSPAAGVGSVVFSKTPGVIPCAHCKQRPSQQTCAICTREVCAPCALAWQSCETKVARETRLGMGWRLTEVDGQGKFGLISHVFTKRTRLVDLKQLAYVRTAAQLKDTVLLKGGRALQLFNNRNQSATEVMPTFTVVMTVTDMRTGRYTQFVLDESSPGVRAWHTTRAETHLWMLTEDETLHIVELDTGRRTLHRGFPKIMVHAVAIDDEVNDLAAVGSYGSVALFGLAGEFTSYGSVRLADGDVAGLAIAGSTIAVIVRASSAGPSVGGLLQVWSASEPRVFRHTSQLVGDDRPRWNEGSAFAISDSGRFIAVGTANDQVTLFDVDSGRAKTLTGHTDNVNLVRFVANDTLLVTADRDNRVILRPFDGDTYLDRTFDVDLSGDEVDASSVAVDDDVS